MNISDLDVSRALVVGDMHGSMWSWEQKVLPEYIKNKCDAIVQVGDFGYGWDSYYLKMLDDLIDQKTTGVEVLWLDGNHESFDRLEEAGAFPNRTEPQPTSDHTVYLPRGYRWEWNDVACLAVGGAYSVDKPLRTPHVDWWPQEELTDEDVARASCTGPAHVMFTHDVVSGVEVPGLPKLPNGDDPFAELCAPNRDRLRAIFNSVWPKYLVHGHFHIAYTDDVSLPHTHVIGLSEESSPGSLAVLDVTSGEPEFTIL